MAVFAEEITERELTAIKREARKYYDMHDHVKFAEIYQKAAKIKNGFEAKTYYFWAIDLEKRRAYRETVIMVKLYLEKTGDSGKFYKEAVSLLEKAEAGYVLDVEDMKKHADVPSDYKSMIHVASGTFEMGNPDGYDIEKPAHTVSLNGYYIGKYEVTQKLWKQVMGYNPSFYKGDARPVDSVNWYDAVEFCNRLSAIEGLTPCYAIDKETPDPNNKDAYSHDTSRWTVRCDFNADGYRLPSEAEWEFAARGGNSSGGYIYSGSDKVDDVAVVWEYSDKNQSTNSVGRRKANELGIFDMTGNVNEWCWDWFSWGYYKDSPSDNPKGPESSYGRVLRGGFLSYTKRFGRVFFRHVRNPIERIRVAGFRLARSEKKGD